MVDSKTLTIAMILLAGCTPVQDPDVLRPVHTSEGLGLLRQGRTSQARERLEYERSKGLQNPLVAWGLGRVYAMEGLTTLARKEYERALQIRESLPEAQMDLAALDYDEGLLPKCLRRLESLPLSDIVLWNRCLTHLKARHPAKALDVSRQLVEHFPEKPIHWELHALTAMAGGEQTEARLALEKLLTIQPRNTCALGNLEALRNRGVLPVPPTRDFAFLDATGASGWLRSAEAIPGDRAGTRSGP